MEEFPFLDKYYALWLLLAQTKSALFKAREKKIGQYIHPNQGIALVYILTHGGNATPSTLSKSLSLELHSVSELIKRMEEKGLVTKSRDPKKRNVIRLAITEKGQELANEIIQIDFIREIICHLTDEQQEQLRSYLSVLLDAAKEQMRK